MNAGQSNAVESNIRKIFFFVFLMVLMPIQVFASTTTGLPWESPLSTLKDSLSGPVALSISIIGIVVGGIMLVFGGEMSEFTRRLIMIVLVVAVIIGANSLLTVLFGAGSALI